MLKFTDNNEVIKKEEIRAILVGLQLSADITYSMKELKGLAEAANAEVLGTVVQSLEKPNTATFIGKGKVEELAEMVRNMDADTVIFNDELSGMQLRNLEDALGVRVIDRTILILDIFADRATSREGKLQVEMAQLKYRLPRLTGFGKSLSRLGGGIGTRGPGEKKLETDRRHIDRRLIEIKEELKQVKTTREVQRSKREKAELPLVALVGYTNAGKSAIMNRMLALEERDEKSVFEKDMLFATLDTSQRKICLDGKNEFILIDTVGFVSKLPHSLVEAFKATLEELKYADLLLHVIDFSYENYEFQQEVTERVIAELGAGEKDRMRVYNKIDKIAADEVPSGTVNDSIYISAKRGDNFDELLRQIKEKLFSDLVTAKLMIPFSRGDISSYICEKAKVISMEYTENGTLLTAELSGRDAGRFREYIVE